MTNSLFHQVNRVFIGECIADHAMRFDHTIGWLQKTHDRTVLDYQIAWALGCYPLEAHRRQLLMACLITLVEFHYGALDRDRPLSVLIKAGGFNFNFYHFYTLKWHHIRRFDFTDAAASQVGEACVALLRRLEQMYGC